MPVPEFQPSENLDRIVEEAKRQMAELRARSRDPSRPLEALFGDLHSATTCAGRFESLTGLRLRGLRSAREGMLILEFLGQYLVDAHATLREKVPFPFAVPSYCHAVVIVKELALALGTDVDDVVGIAFSRMPQDVRSKTAEMLEVGGVRLYGRFDDGECDIPL